MGLTYARSGVNIADGDDFVRRIKKSVRPTFSKAVLSDIGAFGAFYDARFEGYRHPVLVSSVDGVGTKLLVAQRMNRHDTVGQDLVNHCVNDILACGARPLFFLDYFATGRLEPVAAASLLQGFVKACKENSCALVGGETAEMPGLYKDNEYDLSGTIIGVVEKKKILDGKKVRRGDIVIGLPSTGLHTNGFSLARAVLLPVFGFDEFRDDLGDTVGNALLRIHRSYLKPVRRLLEKFSVHGLAHVTGGGILGNTKRILPRGMRLNIDWGSWERPPLFQLIQETGAVPEKEMRRTFNLGVGMTLVVSRTLCDRIMDSLKTMRERPFVMGEIR